ncbi:MAG: hypothetical protein RIF32_04125 [Leptospirales bacterium]|jgi:hypothetical protein
MPSVTEDHLQFLHPAQLVPLAKSDVDRMGRKPVMLRASSEAEDRQGETVLKSCFADAKPMLRQFEKSGYWDWNHETDIYEREIREIILNKGTAAEIAQLQAKKHEAIIGQPLQCGMRDDFPVEDGLKDEGFYCKGFLYDDNAHAQTITRNLESGATIYGASISAHAPRSAIEGGRIKSLTLRKIAIQPRLDSVNQDTWVKLTKATLLSDAATIEKADYASDAPVDGHYEYIREHLGELHMYVRRIESRQLAHSRLILSIPKVQDAIADEISRAIKAKELRLGSEEIRRYLSDAYDFAPSHASDLADYILIKYGASK